MVYIKRKIKNQLDSALAKGKSVLLLGPRQTGKTTMLKHISSDFSISFINPRERLRYELDPSILSDELRAIASDSGNKPLAIIDEVQKVPAIMDVIQYLIDDKVAQFIITGSSARKLKRKKDVNLLPGRVILLKMDALSVEEIPKSHCTLNNLLFYGSLPEVILTTTKEDKEELLDSYVSIYLEEEIRSEAIVRNLANFARFLELAAAESGMTVNYSKLSNIVGVAHTTIAEYYQILEDCLVAQRIEPLLKSKTRHKLSKSNKYLFFDMGLRRLAAKEGTKLPARVMGGLFEHFIGLELVKLAHMQHQRTSILYWRDLDGPEVDWVVQTPNALIPIEVKLTDRPKISDAKHIKTFINEYEEASEAYIVCQVPRKMMLSENITAIPWQSLHTIFGASR